MFWSCKSSNNERYLQFESLKRSNTVYKSSNDDAVFFPLVVLTAMHGNHLMSMRMTQLRAVVFLSSTETHPAEKPLLSQPVAGGLMMIYGVYALSPGLSTSVVRGGIGLWSNHHSASSPFSLLSAFEENKNMGKMKNITGPAFGHDPISQNTLRPRCDIELVCQRFRL